MTDFTPMGCASCGARKRFEARIAQLEAENAVLRERLKRAELDEEWAEYSADLNARIEKDQDNAVG